MKREFMWLGVKVLAVMMGVGLGVAVISAAKRGR